jgi:uncharacterized protein YdaT
MPWSPGEFAHRHNKKLSGHAAVKASEMANAMLREGVPEHIAIATANKHGNKLMRKKKGHEDERGEYGSLDGR